LVNYLKCNDVNNCCVLVEDMLDVDNTTFKTEFTEINQNIKKNNLSNFLSDINQLCKENNIDIENVECRYAGTLFFQTNQIKAEEFLKHLQNLMNEIKNYNDNEALNKFYQLVVKNIEQKNSKFLQ